MFYVSSIQYLIEFAGGDVQVAAVCENCLC